MKIIYSLALLIALQITYFFAITSIQMVGGVVNIFQMTSLKFVLQTVCICPVGFFGGYSLKLDKKHAYLVILSGAADCLYTSTFYGAAMFMPVGNLDGICVAFYIICSTVYDFYKQAIPKVYVVICGLALFGILLLVQPWNIPGISYSGIPCQDIDRSIRSTDGITTISKNVTLNSTTDLSRHNDSKDVGFHGVYLGYILLLCAAISVTTLANVIKRTVQSYPKPVIMFWITLIAGFLSFLSNVILSGSRGMPLYQFPSGKYCLVFFCSYILCTATSNSLGYIVYDLWTISTVALSNVLLTASLYFSQRTFLSQFHPGNANLTEIAGMVIIVLAVILCPAIIFIREQRKVENKISSKATTQDDS